MAEERSNPRVHEIDKHIKRYDWEYYTQLMPSITGEVLDVGCGAGMFIREYSKKPEVISVFGVDKFIEEMPNDIEKVTSKQVNLPDEFVADKKYDTIVSTEFLEHIEREKLEPMLEKIRDSLKPDGIFVGSTPNKVAPTVNPFHLYEYTLSELASIMKNYFTDLEIWDNGQNCTLWKAKL